jgi:Zn-dependent peptidase ImmA (M78 family)
MKINITSLEGVFDNLSVWGETTIEDERNRVFIAKTLLKLPAKVRRKVLDEVIFVHTTAHGTIFKGLFTKPLDEKELRKVKKDQSVSIENSLIILNFKGVKDSEKMDIIAHEIAHYILGHDTIGNEDEDSEKTADDLTEKWGFKRAYKSYTRFI